MSTSPNSLHLGTANTRLLLREEVALEVSGANGLDLSIGAVRSLTRTCRVDEDRLDDLTFLALGEALVQPVRRCVPLDFCLEVTTYSRDNLLDRCSLQHLRFSVHIIVSSEKTVIFFDCLLMQRFGLFLPRVGMIALSQLLLVLVNVVRTREHLDSWLQRAVLVFIVTVLVWSAIVVMHLNQAPLRHRHWRYVLSGCIVLSLSVRFFIEIVIVSLVMLPIGRNKLRGQLAIRDGLDL